MLVYIYIESNSNSDGTLAPFSPGVHPTVHDRVVHGVGHGQPVKRQVHVLYVRFVGQLRHVRRDDEVNVVRQPTNSENRHHDDHHFHHLPKEAYHFKTDDKNRNK